MKDYFIKSILIIIISLFIFPVNIYPWPTGISQRTKKSNSSGCGSCHTFGSVNSTFFSGPDTVIKGQSVQYTLTIIRSSSGLGGVDIAAFNGLLDTSGSGGYLKILNGELTHKNPISIPNSISLNFLYVAPNYVGSDTLFATINIGYTGSWHWVANKVIYIRQQIGINNNNTSVQYELYQNYPNPFNPYTIIRYSLKYNTFVNLDIYDVEGRLITNLVNEFQKSGNYSVPFSISKFPISSGVYYYRMITDNSSEVKSMMLVK
jgi:hypothetical protein